MDVVAYCTEEVTRQGHDVRTLDGIERVGWMLDGWAWALRQHGHGWAPTVDDAIQIGKRVEQLQNAEGIREVNVTVGPRLCPPPERVRVQLVTLFQQQTTMTPMEFYKAFEEIHPFRDGNGRTGKVLLNWVNGTLLDPIFPPSDLWGRPIRNP